MPASHRTTQQTVKLRIPHARLLRALLPESPQDSSSEWPVITRATLAVRAGYTPISGSVTRALNGIRLGSSSGEPQTGLIALGFVEVIEIDIDGVSETNYRITTAGIQAIQQYLVKINTLPPVRDASLCTNDRYTQDEEE